MLLITFCLWTLGVCASSDTKEDGINIELQHSFDMSSFATRSVFKLESETATLLTDNIIEKEEIQQLKVNLHYQLLYFAN